MKTENELHAEARKLLDEFAVCSRAKRDAGVRMEEIRRRCVGIDEELKSSRTLFGQEIIARIQ